MVSGFRRILRKCFGFNVRFPEQEWVTFIKHVIFSCIMKTKEAYALLFLVLVLLIAGCGEEEAVCEPPNISINETCCLDANNNSVCDDQETDQNSTEFIPDVCGNGECETGETCENCWQDCGYCKEIVYVFIPRNFTLDELTSDIDKVYTDDIISFRKDISASGNVSNFFYFSKEIPRYSADFMGVKYTILYKSRQIVLNNILPEDQYANNSASLLRYVNSTRWYLIDKIKDAEMKVYETRISSGKALEDYPTPPTGYKKELKYADWEFRNYTKEEDVIYSNVTLLDNGMVESLYASTTLFSITYKYHTYYDEYGAIALDAFKTVEETKLTNIHTMNFVCAKNLVITLYNFEYDSELYSINKEDIADQVSKNRDSLVEMAGQIKTVCDRKYINEVFTYT